MYMDRVIEISKASNGFVVSCNVPLKPDTKKSDKMTSCCMDSSTNRQYIAKDATEVADLVTDIMPLLDQDFKTEAEFDDAFDKASNDIEDSQDKGEEA